MDFEHTMRCARIVSEPILWQCFDEINVGKTRSHDAIEWGENENIMGKLSCLSRLPF